MKYVSQSIAQKVQNSDSAEVLEYSLGDKDIDIAVATINGNYPKVGFAVNEECKELLYVLSGEGTFATKEKSVILQSGDQVLIEKGELFRYEGTKQLVVVAACTPAWPPEQHKIIRDINPLVP
jgi:mannose-6-phosphate isomerase-like protein (cupin superfamily)